MKLLTDGVGRLDGEIVFDGEIAEEVLVILGGRTGDKTLL